MDLKLRTVRGIGWSVTSQILKLVLSLSVTAILARLLSPDDFGLLAMVAVFTNLFVLLNDLGLPAALIHKENNTEEDLSSCFWFNLLEGLVLALIFIALAPVIAGFYSQSTLTLIVMVISSTLFISSFGMIQAAIFAKGLDFRHLAIIEISSAAVSGLSAIAMAFAGLGVWTLVFYSIISSFSQASLLWIFCRWKPKLIFEWKPVRNLMGFGLNLLGFNFVNYFSRNLDNLLIGRFLGSTSLGYYDIAYRLLLFPLGNISLVIGRVMFPALSIIQNDKKRVQDAYIKATRYIAMASFPLMVGMLVLAPVFVRSILGVKWERSIALIQILALVGLVQSVTTTIGWIYQSQGRTDIIFKWGIFATCVFGVAFLVGLHWGVEGVASAYAIANILLLYPAFAIPFRLIDLKFTYFMTKFIRISIVTTGMGVITLGARMFFERYLQISDVLTLIFSVIIGIISYSFLLFLLDKDECKEAIKLLAELKRVHDVNSENRIEIN